MPQSAPSRNSAWCNRAETVLIAGSIGSSVAAVVLQQVTFAAITSIQLSFVVGLNSWSRKRFDEVSQQNQSAITQLQQQLSQGQNPLNQIEQTIRQLPNYKKLEDLQHHLEQLEIDHQKRIDQLYEELRKQEDQLSQSARNLTSLEQSMQSISRIDIDSLQHGVHNLKDRFEIEFRASENNQSLIAELKNRLLTIEQDIDKSVSAPSDYDGFKEILTRLQNVEGQSQSLNEQVSRLSFLKDFNPSDVQASLRILLEEIASLDVQINRPIEDSGKIYLVDLEAKISQLRETIDSLRTEMDSNEGIRIEIREVSGSLKTSTSELSKRISKLEKLIIPTPSTQPLCEWCGSICHSVYIGGLYDNCKFCSKGCRDSHRIEQERNNY